MAFEKVKLFVRKLFWLLVALAVVLFDLLFFYSSIEVKIIDDAGSSEYNETPDSSYCSILLKFDNYAVDGSISVAFYDTDGKLLSEENEDVYVLLKKSRN